MRYMGKKPLWTLSAAALLAGLVMTTASAGTWLDNGGRNSSLF
ncbi:MAG: hypothetical protein ACTTK0_03395 [Stomatobaculum sp.]